MKILKFCLYFIFLMPGLILNAGNDTTRVVVLSVNDMHAKIDNFPKFKSLVDSIRSVHPYVLLLSAGDNFTGNPVVDQYPEKGYPIVEMMNLTGFDASALGNHEFDYGQDVLAARLFQAEFPFLAANLFYTGQTPLDIKPYTIITLNNGLKAGILGLIQINEAGLPDTHPSRLTGIEFSAGIEVAQEYNWLADSCNIFIGLSHLGFEADVKLAEKMGEFDLIVGGHTHTLVTNPKEYNGVMVMQGGSGVRYVTMTTFCLVDKKIISKKSQILQVDKHSRSDAELESLLEIYNDNRELNEVIGKAISDIVGKDELGCLMTDAMAAIHPIEIAFQNNGGIRIDRLPKGEIRIKDVYKLDPFGNEIILYQMTAKEIKSLIINAYNRDKEIDLQVSGLSYTVVTDKDGFAKDAILTFADGNQAIENRTFIVGISSYIASSYTFDHTDEGRSLYTITAQSLINYIKLAKEVDYHGAVRAFAKSEED
ncbi:MAG: bifunctional metallophosphatase/5'-nucleotidase [Lentimicrobium sp.]|nr:bifunctional metallophosphatase/5'-nucleotidase [Lentimicrobium sp.]